MKRFAFFLAMVLVFTLQARAALFTNAYTGFANNGYVPDASDAGAGLWTDTRTINDHTGETVNSVSVTLNLSTTPGGWNGDLYGYLVHSSGFVVLLNRVGSANVGAYGYGDPGMSVTLGSTGADGSIQTYGGIVTATGSPVGNYSTITPSAWTSFFGTDVNGSWSLLLADMSAGDISQVTGWSLNIDAVPEPTTWALIGFGAIFGGRGLWSLRRRTV